MEIPYYVKVKGHRFQTFCWIVTGMYWKLYVMVAYVIFEFTMKF